MCDRASRRDALAVNQKIGARVWLAHTQEDYARMLLGRGEPDDTRRADGLLEQAIAGYREVGSERRVSGGRARDGRRLRLASGSAT